MVYLVRGRIPEEERNPLNRLSMRLYEPFFHLVLRHPAVTLAVVLLLGALAGTILWGPLAGVVIAAAWGSHILADQSDFLGCNLGAFFTRRRIPGFGFTSATADWSNAVVTWAAFLWLFWNLARPVTGGIAGLDPLRYSILAGVVPLCIYRLMLRVVR